MMSSSEGWDELIKHGRPEEKYTIVEKAEAKMGYGRPQILTWGDDIPLALTLAEITGARETKRKKRADTQRIGKLSEGRAKTTLKRMGFTDIIRCTTGFGTAGRFSTKKAEADFKGWWKEGEPGEKRMLCEVKHTEKPKLGLPALRKHQMENLSKLAKRGGIALLIWTYQKEKLVLRWGVNGIDGFVKGSPLTIERARELSIVGGQPALWSL